MDEEFSKRHIKQAKIKKWIEPFYRDSYGKEYAEVDGIVMIFYFPFTGEDDLFKYRASTFALGPYPNISISHGFVSLRYEYSLNEMQNENAKDSTLKRLKRDIKNIRDGISYANKDVESYNASLQKQALHFLEEKKKKVESFFSVANMFEVTVKKSAYAETTIQEELEKNGLPRAEFFTDKDRRAMRIRIPIHPSFLNGRDELAGSVGKATNKSSKKKVEQHTMILNYIADGEWHKTSEVAAILGLKDTRTKELLKELVVLEKLDDNGKTKGKLYRLK